MYKIYYSRVDGKSICTDCIYKNLNNSCNNALKEKNISTAISEPIQCEYFREYIESLIKK